MSREYHKTIECGKVDWDGVGRKSNAVELELSLTYENGRIRFSCCGSVWNRSHTDLVAGGQCLDEIFRFKEMDPYCEIYRLWKDWHLNDCTAGSPNQEKAVKTWLDEGYVYDYGEACRMLEGKGLLEDKDYLYEGKPYRYGTAWLFRKIPETDLKKIRAWING